MGSEAIELTARMIDALLDITEQAQSGGIKIVTEDGKAAIGSAVMLLWSIRAYGKGNGATL